MHYSTMPRSHDVERYKKKFSKSSTNDQTIFDISSYVLLNRVILKFVGLYPKNGTRTLTIAFCMLLIAVPQVLQIYHTRDLSVVLEISSVLLTLILALLKMIVWTARRNEIADLITYLFGDYWNMINFVDEEVASCFLRYAAFAKAFTKSYIFLVVGSLLLFFGLPLVQISIANIKGSSNETRAYLFPGLYPEGWTESPFFEIVVLSQIIATSTCGAVILAIDTLVVTAVFHTCGHFKIVQINLRSLGEDMNHIVDPIDSRGNEKSVEILVRQKLRICIEHHQITLKFSETLERLFSPLMLCQVLASMMIICLVGVEVSSTLTDRGKVLKYLSYLSMALFQLMSSCLPGDDLIHQSLAVSDAAYATNWYKISKILETDVKFIIIRGQRPARITAGKFTVMSLEHFMTILSTSMSYFTVLRSLN